LEVAIMNPRRSARITAVLCGMGGIGWFAGFGSAGVENTASPTEDLAQFHTADLTLTDALQPAATGSAGVANVDVTRAAELVTGMPADGTVTSDEAKSIIESALINSSQMVPPETPPVQVATASTPNAMPRGTSIEDLNECLVGEICIDRYLWALYQRTPKEDTIKVQELREVTVKKKRSAAEPAGRRASRL